MQPECSRRKPRPSDPEVQADFYSEKKKKHTVKNAVITTLTGLVLFVGATVPGKTHDKTIAETQYAFPYPCLLWQDTGYQRLCTSQHGCHSTHKETAGKGVCRRTEGRKQSHFLHSDQSRACHFRNQEPKSGQRSLTAQKEPFFYPFSYLELT